MVYFTYGLAIFITAIFAYKILDKPNIVNKDITLKSVYGEAFANKKLIKLVSIEFLLGFSVLGSFMYSGDFVQQTTGYNILAVGAVLAFFGLGTFLGGRYASLIKEKIGPPISLYAGLLGLICWGIMGFLDAYYIMIVLFLGYGLSFILLHAFIVATAQKLLPSKTGLVMSLVSFNLFVGGGIGTLINSYILNIQGFKLLFLLAGVLIFIAGVLVYRVLSE